MSTEPKPGAGKPATPSSAGPQTLLLVSVILIVAAIGFIVYLVATGRGQYPVQNATANAAAPAPGLEPLPAPETPSRPPATAPNRGQLLPSGLRIESIREGSGPLVTRADTVILHYELRLPGGPVIESNFDQPQGTPMRLDGVIPGFAEGLTHMRAGGEARLWVPPSLGYGADAPPGGPFGPNDVLEFRIRVERIVPGGGSVPGGNPDAG
jgi:FKBP-type peptidyl-prolyl cis-trans isomerase